MGLFWQQRPDFGTWIGAVLAAWGLYLLSITRGFNIAFGDFLVLVGAFFWAAHVHILARFSPRVDSVQLAFCQFVACSVFSLITAGLFETIALEGLRLAAIPIFYGGVCSVGVAYTLQVVAQRNAHPTHAAIILSLEAAFAALAGWLLLGETLSFRGMMGCGLMLAGMLLSQFQIRIDLIAGALRQGSGSEKHPY
jgi:drug/metabolite transporter (DMT)-like permease